MTHYEEAVARGACPDRGCTNETRATWHHNVPCPFSAEGRREKAAS